MAGLHFDITGDNTNLMNKLRQTENGIRQTSRSIEQSGLGIEEMFNRIGKSVAGLGAAFSAQQFASQVMKVRGEFQQLEVAFETMLGSAEKANSLMAQITRTAAVTPFGLQDVAGGAKQLLAYGVAAEDVNDTLVRLGDIAAGLSIPLNDLVYLYGTTMTQGRMFTQDLRQFQGRGIPLADELAKQFGVTKDKVGELVTAGRVGFEEMRKAIVSMTSEGGKFGGLMEAQSKTITGQISNIEDAIDGMFNQIGQSSEGVINAALGGVSALVENYEKVGGVLATLVGSYGAYKAALLTNIALEKIQAVQRLASIRGINAMSTFVGVLTKKTAALNLVMNASPWGIAAAGVTALGIGAYKLFTYQTDLEKSTQKLNQEISREQSGIDDLFGKLDAAKEGTEAYETVKQEIINQYGSYLNGLRDEVATLKDVEAAYLAVSSAAKLAAQERAIADANEKANQDYNSKKGNVFNEISGLFQNNRRAASSVLTAIQNDFAKLGDGNISKETEDEIKKYKEVGDQVLRQISFIKAYRLERDKTFQGNRKNFDEWGVLSMSESELSKRIESVKALRKQMEGSGKEGNLVTSSGKQVFTSLLEIDSYLSALEVRSAKITEGRKVEKTEDGDTYTEAYKKAEKRWKDATKAVEDAKKKSQKEYEAAVQELDSAESDFKKLGGDTTGKGKKKSDKEVEEAEKRAKELLSIRRQNQQAEINLMKEGSEKRIAQINLNYQKELDAIKEQEAEWKKAQGGKLTEEQQSILIEWDAKATQTADKLIEDENKAKIKREREAQQELLIQFGNYQQQRQGIEQKYADMKAQTDVKGEKELLDAQMEAELKSIDEKFGYTTTAMADLFEDASQKSVNSIQKIIDKYEMLVAYKSGALQEDGTNVTKEELLGLGFSEKDLEALEKGEINIKDVTDAIKALKGELKEKSPWKTFTNDLGNAIDKLKNAKGNSSKIGEGLTGIGDAITSFAPALKDFGANIGNIFGFDDAKIQSAIDGVAGLGQTAAGVGQIMSGDIVGGAMSAISGISSVVTAFEGLFGADYSQYNRLVEEYNGLIDVWDKIIDRKREYINIDYGNEARKAGEESLNIINKQIDAYRTLGEERLNAGASIGSHSIGVRQRNAMSQEGWTELQAAAREIGFNYASVADGRMTGLFKLSAEQLDDLRSKAPTFWAKLDEDVRMYLEKIIESNDQLEETKNLLNEATTGVSFDSFYDSFVSTLSDMNADSKDFADDFGEYLKTAILSNLIANKYRGRIQELYDQWAKKSDTDGDGIYDLTSEETAQLKEAQKALADQMIAERDAMAKTFGWEDTYSQEASAKGFPTMSQDTGEELNGRFTSLQVSNEEIKNQMVQAVLMLSQAAAVSSQGNAILNDILQQQALANIHLADIVKYTKSASLFGEKLDAIVENTKNL